MIGIQEFMGDQLKVERFLNKDAVILGWNVLSVQKMWSWNPFKPRWLVTYEKRDPSETF